MKALEYLSIPLGEKVYVTEIYHDHSSDLIAVGLKSSVIIYQVFIDVDETSQPRFQLVQAINHDSIVHCLSWSPQTTLALAPRCVKFATGSSDYCVRLFTTDLGQNESLQILKGHKDYVNTIAFHPQPDAGQLISGSDDHTVMLWQFDGKTVSKNIHTFTFEHPVMTVVWHPDEVSKAMIAEKNGVIHIFNITSYKPILSLYCNAEPLLTADWSLSNSLIIAAAVRSEVVVFDTSKMASVARKKMSQDIIKSVKIAPFSDSLFATAAQPNYSVQIMSSKNNQTIPVVQKEPIAGISWHAKRNFLVVGHNEMVTVYQMSNKQS